jgi:hypothetical protein
MYTLGTVVIEVLTVERSSPLRIHRHLRSMYAADATDLTQTPVLLF